MKNCRRCGSINFLWTKANMCDSCYETEIKKVQQLVDSYNHFAGREDNTSLKKRIEYTKELIQYQKIGLYNPEDSIGSLEDKISTFEKLLRERKCSSCGKQQDLNDEYEKVNFKQICLNCYDLYYAPFCAECIKRCPRNSTWYRKSEQYDGKKFCSEKCYEKHYAPICKECRQKCLDKSTYSNKNSPEEKFCSSSCYDKYYERGIKQKHNEINSSNYQTEKNPVKEDNNLKYLLIFLAFVIFVVTLASIYSKKEKDKKLDSFSRI